MIPPNQYPEMGTPESAPTADASTAATSRSMMSTDAITASATKAESKNRVGITTNMGRRRGPQHRTCIEVPQDLSESIRECRNHTAGLSNRLPLASLEGMRAGTVAGPQTLARRYLMAGKRHGLPKDWGQRFATWVQRTVDCIWPMEPTPLVELRRRALAAESLANHAEYVALTASCRATLEADRDALTREVAADTVLLGEIERKLETLT
jgi:hypothetical protein